MTPTLAVLNAVLQLALLAAVLVGAFVGARRHFHPHCLYMRILFGVQIVMIAVFMSRSFGLYVSDSLGAVWVAVIVIHHTFGLAVIGLFAYINLAWFGVVRAPHRYRGFMLSALASWLIALGLGLTVYLHIWRGIQV